MQELSAMNWSFNLKLKKNALKSFCWHPKYHNFTFNKNKQLEDMKEYSLRVEMLI